MARIISIVNQKGGTGKSACTANLAVGLAQKNMKVLIVDADPQSDVSAGFGYRDCDESNETLTALMDTVMKDEDIPSDCYIRHQAEGIDIICSNIGLAGTEVQLVNAMSREYVLKQILYGIKDQYDANIPSGVTIGNVMLPSVKETFEQIWPDAVKKALEILFKQNRTEKMSMAQYQIYVSKLWSEICQKVGYMNIVDYDNFGDIKSIFYDLEKRHLIKKENDGIE